MDFKMLKSRIHDSYKSYSVLPQLHRLSGDIFSPVASRPLQEKRNIANSRQVFFESEMTDNIYESVCRFIVEHHPRIDPPHTFDNLAMQINEDLIIHRLTDRDWMAAGHICFPSGWDPKEKIGKNFAEIHSPIPDMDLSISQKIVKAMINHGPFERYVWSVIFEDKLDFHPSTPRQKFDPDNPVLLVKVERQITYGFPQHNAALFILQQHLIPEDQIEKVALLKTLRGMTKGQLEYKGLEIEELERYLHDS